MKKPLKVTKITGLFPGRGIQNDLSHINIAAKTVNINSSRYLNLKRKLRRN